MPTETTQGLGIDERLRPFLDSVAGLLAQNFIRDRSHESPIPDGNSARANPFHYANIQRG